MGPPQKISSVHVSGVTLSYLVAATYSSAPATKYTFDLYGHYDEVTKVTDTADSVDILDVVVVGAVPMNSTFPGSADHVGTLSISKSPFHKLSFKDTQYANGRHTTATSGREAAPKIFILMTEDPIGGPSTLTVNFTAYQVTQAPQEQPRVLPIRTGNIVNSMNGFTKIADLFCHNPSIIHTGKCDDAQEAENSLLHTAVDRIESDSKERAALIHRIAALQRAIAAKKGTAAD